MKRKIFVVVFLSIMLAMAGCGSSGDTNEIPQTETGENEAPETETDINEAPEIDTNTNETPQTDADTDGTSEELEEDVQPHGTEPDENEDDGTDKLADILNDIFEAVPGTAGSSLKSMSAAGALLDWTEDYADKADKDRFKEAVAQWKEEILKTRADVYTDDDMLQALSSVQTNAQLIVTDRASAEEILKDAGYELKRDSYSEDKLLEICDMLRIDISGN